MSSKQRLRTAFRRSVPLPVRVRLRSVLLAVNRAAGVDAASEDERPWAQAEVTPNIRAASSDTSQHGEVTLLRSLLREGFPKVIVDVGAYDGVSYSNSRPFVLDRWRALLIEPHPLQFARLAATYRDTPHVTCVNRACSDRPGVLPLYLGADGEQTMMSTLCADNSAWFRATRSDDSVDVEVATLTSLLSDAGFPRDISILLVDAEGMDYEVLCGLDFDRFCPRIVVTEEYLFDPLKHNRKYRLLLDAGYVMYTMVGCNTVWLGMEWLPTVLQAPPAFAAAGTPGSRG